VKYKGALMSNNLSDQPYPVNIVLHPSWWYKHEGITFDFDFFYHPKRRVEDEKKMEKALYERWGRFGLGKDRNRDIPLLGPVHLAAGYLVSEMLGCKVEYTEKDPPQVICAKGDYPPFSIESAFSTTAWKQVENLRDSMLSLFGHVKGDINWSGILNTAMDLEGEKVFIDFFNKPDEVMQIFTRIAQVTEKFFTVINDWTGTSSISVNRSIAGLKHPVFLHSECSHTMISVDDYEEFLKPFDREWNRRYKPYGIHYCGRDPHRFAESWSKLESLDFLDVGAGGDPALIRKYLPDTFLNLRLDPTVLIRQTPGEIEGTMRTLAATSGDPKLTGFCCINLDDTVTEEQVTAVFETGKNLREELAV
jgi:hypothetical protein